MVLGCCSKVRSNLVPLIAPHLHQYHMIPEHFLIIPACMWAHYAAHMQLLRLFYVCVYSSGGGCCYSHCFYDAWFIWKLFHSWFSFWSSLGFLAHTLNISVSEQMVSVNPLLLHSSVQCCDFSPVLGRSSLTLTSTVFAFNFQICPFVFFSNKLESNLENSEIPSFSVIIFAYFTYVLIHFCLFIMPECLSQSSKY